LELIEGLLAHEDQLIVITELRQLGLVDQDVVGHKAILHIILSVSLGRGSFVHGANDGLLGNAVRHLAIKHYLILIIAHLIELFVSQLALALRPHEGYSRFSKHIGTVLGRLLRNELLLLGGFHCLSFHV